MLHHLLLEAIQGGVDVDCRGHLPGFLKAVVVLEAQMPVQSPQGDPFAAFGTYDQGFHESSAFPSVGRRSPGEESARSRAGLRAGEYTVRQRPGSARG